MTKLIIPIFFLFCMHLTSCTKDTCNSKLGDTFQNIENPTVSQNVFDAYIINANMETMDKLTEAYFDSTILIGNDKDRFGNQWQNDDELVAEIQFTKVDFSLTLVEIDLDDYESISLHFRLSDREEFIDCEHGGSGDSYYLNLHFSIIKNSIEELVVSDFQWDEEFSAGPY